MNNVEKLQRTRAFPTIRVESEPSGDAHWMYMHSDAAPGVRPCFRSQMLDDVLSFHADYYRPDNATVLVAGRVDPAETIKLVAQAFGPLKKPAAPIPSIIRNSAGVSAQNSAGRNRNPPIPARINPAQSKGREGQGETDQIQ